MNKKVTIINTIMIIILFLIIVANNLEHHYDMEATVSRVDWETRTVEAIDVTGNIWIYEFDKTNLKENEKIQIKFYDNCTSDNREDDKIVNIKRLH